MTSSGKPEAQNAVRFFTSLRRLGREVDQGVKDIHSKLDTHDGLKSGGVRHLTLKGLLDHKKDVDSVKLSARTLLRQMRNRGSEFEQTLQACSDVIDAQLKQLCNVQAHLMQYGFVPQKEPEDAVEEATTDTSTAEGEPPATPPQQDTANKQEIEKKCKLSPCLEDFGLSSYTLSMLNRPSQRAAFKVPSAAVPQSVGGNAASVDSVPSPFQNMGLTVTPSLFSSQSHSQAQCYAGCDRTTEEVFDLLYTPNVTTGRQGPAADHGHCFQSAQTGLAKTLDFSDSPVPPVLHTPGVKQIPRLRDAVISPEGDKGNVARQLKLEGAKNSPVPPILRTPGIQQIPTRSAATEHHRGKMESCGAGNHSDQMELPRTPEMTYTYSLKDLEGMTVSLQNTDLSSTFSERSAATSYFDTSDSAQTGSFLQQSVQGGNVPPQRAGHGPKPTGFAVQEPQLSNWTRDRFNTESLDMPASPELTMSYTSMTRSSASSQSALTVSVNSQRLGVDKGHGWRFGVGSHIRHNENTVQNDKVDIPSLYLTNTTEKLTDTDSRVLWSRENIISPSMPKLTTRKLEPGVCKSFLPDQPKLQPPLTDLPATPKFMGSYHFMSSKD